MSADCFQLKGSLLPQTVLELYHYSPEIFVQQIAEKVKQAPMFFQQTPVVISLEKLNDPTQRIDFSSLTTLCREFGLIPIAVKGGSEQLAEEAERSGLAHMPASPPKIERESSSSRRHESVKQDVVQEIDEKKEEKKPENTPAHSAARPSKMITSPVRSGQQIYAKDCDLIILSQVSPGAEVIADGNIHIYGALRGRALAGVNGDDSARIFCKSLEAELVSIAGQYMLNEDLRNHHWEAAVQAYIKDEILHIDLL